MKKKTVAKKQTPEVKSTTPAFWLVWRDGGSNPTKKHATESEARAEAERLAAKHPGSRFFVLPALQFAQAVTPAPTWANAEPVATTTITFTFKDTYYSGNTF